MIYMDWYKQNEKSSEEYIIRVNLPEECGYKGYSIECTYNYCSKKGKYYLSMWLLNNYTNSCYRIDSQEIDMKVLSGTKIEHNKSISKIIQLASLSGYFNYYIEYERFHQNGQE